MCLGVWKTRPVRGEAGPVGWVYWQIWMHSALVSPLHRQQE